MSEGKNHAHKLLKNIDKISSRYFSESSHSSELHSARRSCTGRKPSRLWDWERDHEYESNVDWRLRYLWVCLRQFEARDGWNIAWKRWLSRDITGLLSWREREPQLYVSAWNGKWAHWICTKTFGKLSIYRDDERQQWMQRVGDWDTIVKPDLINILNHYEQQGVQEFAIFGFCWGGKVSTLASTELGDRFKASGLVHPSSVTTGEAQGVQIPMYLMPSSNDLDMVLWGIPVKFKRFIIFFAIAPVLCGASNEIWR